MAIRAGGQTALIATSDTIGHRLRSEFDTRKTVSERVKCDEQHVLILSRHNHSSIGVPNDRENEEAVAAAQAYRQKVREGTVEACVKAAANLRPAEIAAGTAMLEEKIGEIRRMQFGSGGCTQAWNTGPVSVPGEKFVGPPGPPSDRIDFLCAREPGGERPFALLTSYAAHVHLAGVPYFNGEVPGGVKQAIQRRIPGITVLYANSTAGDLDMHCTHPMPPGGQKAEMEWFRRSLRVLGDRFADAVVPAIPRGGYVRPTELKHCQFLSERKNENDRRTRVYMINAIALGGTALVSIPGEMFNELGRQMHAQSYFEHLLLLGYNGGGGLGYIGTPISYEQGGYEVGRGPAPSPEEEARIIASGARSRIVGRARMDTGLEIVRSVREVLKKLAG
jgi:hypothetical protein